MYQYIEINTEHSSKFTLIISENKINYNTLYIATTPGQRTLD